MPPHKACNQGRPTVDKGGEALVVPVVLLSKVPGVGGEKTVLLSDVGVVGGVDVFGVVGLVGVVPVEPPYAEYVHVTELGLMVEGLARPLKLQDPVAAFCLT